MLGKDGIPLIKQSQSVKLPCLVADALQDLPSVHLGFCFWRSNRLEFYEGHPSIALEIASDFRTVFSPEHSGCKDAVKCLQRLSRARTANDFIKNTQLLRYFGFNMLRLHRGPAPLGDDLYELQLSNAASVWVCSGTVTASSLHVGPCQVAIFDPLVVGRPTLSEDGVAVFASNVIPERKVVISKVVQDKHAAWKELVGEAKMFRHVVAVVPLEPQNKA